MLSLAVDRLTRQNFPKENKDGVHPDYLYKTIALEQHKQCKKNLHCRNFTCIYEHVVAAMRIN